MKLNNSKSRNSSGSSQQAQKVQQQPSSTSEGNALANPILTGLLERSAETGKAYAPLMLQVAWASAGMTIAEMSQSELFPHQEQAENPNQNQNLLQKALEAVHGAEAVQRYLPESNTLLLEAGEDDYEPTDEPHFVTADDAPSTADADSV